MAGSGEGEEMVLKWTDEIAVDDIGCTEQLVLEMPLALEVRVDTAHFASGTRLVFHWYIESEERTAVAVVHCPRLGKPADSH